MITRDNLKDVILMLDKRDIKRIEAAVLNCTFEYCCLFLHTFNVGSVVTIKLTNLPERFSNISYGGNCILETSEVHDLIWEHHHNIVSSVKECRLNGNVYVNGILQ